MFGSRWIGWKDSRRKGKKGIGGEKQLGSMLAGWELQASVKMCHMDLCGAKPFCAQ